MHNKSTFAHPLSRFVTRDALALHLGVKPEDIYKISYWRYIIHVVAKGKSRFVSYADMPPILGVAPPQKADFIKWQKRIKARKTKYVPKYWARFYVKKIKLASSSQTLLNWENLVKKCKSLMSLEEVKKIDQALVEEKSKLEKLSKHSLGY